MLGDDDNPTFKLVMWTICFIATCWFAVMMIKMGF